MKNISLIFVCIGLLFSNVALSQEVDLNKKHGAPVVSFMVQFSSNNNDDRSSVLGIEAQVNLPVSELFVLGFHGNMQKQKYGDIEPGRVGGGVSLNYYLPLNTMTPYIGIKRTYYDEFFSKTQDALDCLYCSNVLKDYSGKEDFVTVGINFGNSIVQLDIRTSDNRSKLTESANDPWGVGASYYNNYSNVPDPDIILSIGIPFGSH